MKKSWKLKLIQATTITLGLWTVLSYQACAPMPKAGSEEENLPSTFNYSTGSNTEKLALAYLITRCDSCHRSGAGHSLSDVRDVNSLVKNGWILPGNATNSKLYKALDGYSGVSPMPPGVSLPYQERTTIRNWILEIKLAPTDTTLPPTTIVAPPTTAYTGPAISFRTQVAPILTRSCGGCHDEATGAYSALMRSPTWVVKGWPNDSSFVTSSQPAVNGMAYGGMPNDSSTVRLNLTEWNLIKNWILSGAPDSQ